MADPDATYGFEGDTIVALLSANVEAFLCNIIITVDGIPYGKAHDTRGIAKFGTYEGLGSNKGILVGLEVVGILFVAGNATTTPGIDVVLVTGSRAG